MWNRLSARIRDPSDGAADSWRASVTSRRTSAPDARSAASRAAAPDTANCSSARSRSALAGMPRSRSRSTATGGAAGAPDERAAGPAAPGLREALLAQARQRFPQGHGGHAELGGELGLGRELLPVHEQAELDGLAHPLHHFLRPARRGEGRYQRYGVPAVGHAVRL